ncbi:MAG: SMC-Scp complex subunit ScpB [Mesotoga sp.]|uniref:SMC-Scp complex subunit ScpB n=1 Tax=unclassified Mesotoga TaxID=1184398 RepID=UPI000EF1EA55|nr:MULTISPECIES: SMC-Scp complex subunit ScpB [unclassified Mesotoga]MDI9368694.1 SMC-Scp complex subunit ScpB [Thermotogota bacterium]NLT45421.1 SMC-Scp complex subunit ScpB [Thermotogaceae bacterium]MDD2333043.1 SMC-Scp complex subunit ScpB [Mesotoga sp.]MDD3680400.1 SMC-Scp complex subunit ScpB [Mesotoga sp.]MDD4207254.1 SMC-Scp complex subunit ScpB [Mesotoga sp.]
MSEELTKKAVMEALIFSAKSGIEPSRIASIIGIKLSQVMLLLEELEKEYEGHEHGVVIKSVNGKLRFYTKASIQSYVSQISVRPLVSITDTQMEVLAIVAIKGPLTRNDVELVRGRSSQSQLLELSKMGLIGKRKSKLPGRPYLYKVSSRFYELFQVDDLAEIVQGLAFGEGEDKFETSRDNLTDNGNVEEKINASDFGRESEIERQDRNLSET